MLCTWQYQWRWFNARIDPDQQDSFPYPQHLVWSVWTKNISVSAHSNNPLFSFSFLSLLLYSSSFKLFLYPFIFLNFYFHSYAVGTFDILLGLFQTFGHLRQFFEISVPLSRRFSGIMWNAWRSLFLLTCVRHITLTTITTKKRAKQ